MCVVSLCGVRGMCIWWGVEGGVEGQACGRCICTNTHLEGLAAHGLQVDAGCWDGSGNDEEGSSLSVTVLFSESSEFSALSPAPPSMLDL